LKSVSHPFLHRRSQRLATAHDKKLRRGLKAES
jgi:hypothetical protein